MIRLMEEIRQHIAAGTFAAFREKFLAEYRLPDQTVRHEQKEKRRQRMEAPKGQP